MRKMTRAEIAFSPLIVAAMIVPCLLWFFLQLYALGADYLAYFRKPCDKNAAKPRPRRAF